MDCPEAHKRRGDSQAGKAGSTALARNHQIPMATLETPIMDSEGLLAMTKEKKIETHLEVLRLIDCGAIARTIINNGEGRSDTFGERASDAKAFCETTYGFTFPLEDDEPKEIKLQSPCPGISDAELDRIAERLLKNSELDGE